LKTKGEIKEFDFMAKVFISYSRKDMAIVRQLANDLEKADFDVWWDISELKGGDAWMRTIQAALKTSKYCVVVLSPNSVESGWVEKEYSYAISRGTKIIPIISKTCEVPLALGNIHHIDFRGNRYDSGLRELLIALQVSPDTIVPDTAQRSFKEKLLAASRDPKWQIIGIIVAAIVAALAWGFYTLYLAGDDSGPKMPSPSPTQTATTVAMVLTETNTLTFTPIWTPTRTPVPPTDTIVPPTATPVPPAATKTPTPTSVPPTATATHTPRPPTLTPVPTAAPQPAGPIALTIYLRDTRTGTGFAALSGDQPNGGMIYEEGKFVYGEAAVQIGDTVYHFDKPEVAPGEPEQLPDPWRVEFEFAEELLARSGNAAGFDPKKAQFWVGALDDQSAVGEESPYSLTMKLYEGDELRKSIQVLFTVADAPTSYAIEFEADKTVVDPGEWVIFRWHVENVQAVYLDWKGGVGAPGDGWDSRPIWETTDHTLRVVLQNGETVTRTITITVQK
jgi:hypothetical protein